MKLYLIPVSLDANTTHFIPDVVRQVILNTDFYWVENIRTARRFISTLKTGRKIDELRFFILDKKTKTSDLKGYMSEIPPNKNIGVMSEAGCPGIADPGATAVRYGHQHNWDIIPLAGASSITSALMASGMNGQSFVFHGYLPISKHARRKALQLIEKEAIQKKQTQVFIETPYRNNSLLQDIVNCVHEETWFAIACEVTAENRFIRTKKIKNWKQNLPDLHKRPTVFSLFCD